MGMRRRLSNGWRCIEGSALRCVALGPPTTDCLPTTGRARRAGSTHEIVAAAGANDFDGVQTAVSRIGYSEQMGQMCQHMGAAAPGFTQLSLKFHHTADTIGEAAKRRNAEDVIKALSDTLAICTTCHQTFKQQIVDDAAWLALTKVAPPRELLRE